ncbi:hypothetical protein LSPCS325_20080 [Lysinibacillus sp. CTST325]
MPFWLALNRFAGLRGAMASANATVVGIVAAAFIHPIQNGLWCLIRWKVQAYMLC